MGQFEKALGDYAEALRIKPDFRLAHANSGYAYSRLKRYSEAIVSFTKAIDQGLATSEMYRERGRARLLVGELTLALGDLDRARQTNAKDPDVHFLIGVAHMDEKRAGSAVDAFTEAITLNPELAESYNYRGMY